MWRLFAFMDGEDDTSDERRILADWQLQDAVRWCQTRGYDHIYLSRSGEVSRFEKKRPPAGVTHSGIRGESGAHADREGSVA